MYDFDGNEERVECSYSLADRSPYILVSLHPRRSTYVCSWSQEKTVILRIVGRCAFCPGGILLIKLTSAGRCRLANRDHTTSFIAT